MSSGIAPAPDRKTGKKWKDFLRANLSVISAVDFFTAEVLILTGFLGVPVMIVMQLALLIVTALCCFDGE